MERDIHAKRSEEAACLDAMGEIDEKAALLKLPPKPTDRTPEDLRGLLDDVEDRGAGHTRQAVRGGRLS